MPMNYHAEPNKVTVNGYWSNLSISLELFYPNSYCILFCLLRTFRERFEYDNDDDDYYYYYYLLQCLMNKTCIIFTFTQNNILSDLLPKNAFYNKRWKKIYFKKYFFLCSDLNGRL